MFENVAGVHGLQGRQLIKNAINHHALAQDAHHGNQDPPAEERTTGDDQRIPQANDITQAEHRSFGEHVVFQAHLLGNLLAEGEVRRRERLAPYAKSLMT